jgi:serine/threonine protein kinase
VVEGEAITAEFSTGSVVGGKYRVDGVIGDGGLGFVLKAWHQQLDQAVAIKVLKPEAAARPGVVERFLREARLAARIKNEHAVKVHDVDEAESGVPYMVMEYLEGRDLEQIVMESPLQVHVAIEYLLQAIEAVAEAHAAGIVHRDLKPANLFLARRPGSTSVVKVLDFGISKVTSADAQQRKRLTRVDERVGTPAFMSPEQLQAAPDVDARADVWALGVVLYELITGKLPFDGVDVPELCAAVLTKAPVPLAAVHPDVPPELEEVITRCLQKDRSKRYQNVAELAQDLGQIYEGESPSRVRHIAQVIGEAGHKIRPPTPFPGTIDLASLQPPAPPAPAPAVEDRVQAVFSDEAGTAVAELEFRSIDAAYEHATTLGATVVRCDVYDEFEGVRGRLRVTYVRSMASGHWVPQLP